MKFSFCILMSLLFSNVCYTQTKDCSKFRTGTFKMITKNGTFILKRSKNLQVETEIDNKKEMTFIVKWVDSCTYTLFPTKKSFKKFPDWPKDGLITVTIIEIKPKSYIQTTTSNFADFKLTNEITLIE
jgi:hypothetical protein